MKFGLFLLEPGQQATGPVNHLSGLLRQMNQRNNQNARGKRGVRFFRASSDA
jgi:hypothetical protein